MLLVVMRLGHVGHRWTIWIGAILAVAVAVAGQHYFSFVDWKRDEAAKVAQQFQGKSLFGIQEMLPAASSNFVAFMKRQAALGRRVTAGFKNRAEFDLRGAAAWASWAVDGLLVLFPVCLVVYAACQSPYCHVCRSWYRTTRAGRLTSEAVQRMAAAAVLPPDKVCGPARYRLSHCLSGCGATRLELACDGKRSAKVMETWLSAAQREQIGHVLDGTNRP